MDVNGTYSASLSDRIFRENKEGGRLLQLGNLEEAREHFIRALELFALCSDSSREEQAALYNNLGHIDVSLGDFPGALENFRQAAHLFIRVEDNRAVAWQLANQGSVYRDMEKAPQALEMYTRALDMFSDLSCALETADQHTNIAYIQYILGDFSGAGFHYERALELYVESGESQKASMVENNLQFVKGLITRP